MVQTYGALHTMSGRVVPDTGPAPTPSYATLTDKIVAAANIARVNKAVEGIRFESSVDGDIKIDVPSTKGILMQVTKLDDSRRAAALTDALNRAVNKVIQDFQKDNETDIRKILGRSSRR